MGNRPSFDQYFLEIAAVVAKRSTCNRKQVGCVLVVNKQIISTGYGGSITGQPHCTDVGCLIDEATGGCIRTVHAEMNAVAHASKNGVSTLGATAYVTLSPCVWCLKTLANAGIKRIVYAEEYRIPPDTRFTDGIELVHMPGGSGATLESHADTYPAPPPQDA